MKGQGSIEALLILAAVLTVTSGFLYQGIESSNSINALSAAKNGAENVTSRIEIENEVTIRITSVSEQNENITITLDNWGGKLPTDTKKKAKQGALKFLYQAFNGNFPNKEINKVNTAHHTYRVIVEYKEG
ncbi:hypothetical protein AKJ52_01900 [candidate division MSBL1 archaeon SCGC-AAA382C18]|uniref:Class III signal peptide-containing protein n=1 Tax=candidate division MSBL1 archaeon SCGC-AAA382C18 TaxID=1698281 RepID=A0A133VJP7_9EURY|nr:hypothetical protein AKJ52_01900 [candidate division MSBL1 archaeon SCGC-AAA382C18]